MIGQRIKGLGAAIPPLLQDAALALVLGLVGAAQLISDSHIFRGPPRHSLPGGGLGPTLGPGRVGGPGAGGNPAGPGGPRPIGPVHADFLTYLLLGLCAASLIIRRRYPLLSLAGVTFFGAAFLLRDQPAFTIQLIVLVAIYGAVADSSLTRSGAVGIALLSAGVLAVALVLADTPRRDSVWAMDAAWVVAAIFLGDSVRSRRAFATETERSRDEEGRRRVSDERLQIARELHDVVGHNISLINVQAGAGAHVLYKDELKAQEAFANIRQASHETLQELRSMVGVLREPVVRESKEPTVGLDALDQLIKAMTDAGQTVELSVTGRRRHLSGVVDLSAYRILQEALTNTLRHAPRSKVKVAVDYRDDVVTLEVTNGRGDGSTPRSQGGGLGLVGMRERVSAIGGRLDAGPQPDGGFRVRAELPVPLS